MFIALLLGVLMIVANMGIQVIAVVITVRYFIREISRDGFGEDIGGDMATISIVLLVLMAGHLIQFATWAALFIWLGEFSDFYTAFYHSTVNFASLGYGDIVMSEKWRLLGALEAANGVMMFGLTAGAILSVMTRLFDRRRHVDQRKPPNGE